jgi:hypothetical protein
MKTEYYLCKKCLHVISNPVCSECFLGHVNEWLSGRRISSEKKTEVIDELRRSIKISDEGISDVDCVICHENTVDFCTYCLVLRTKWILKKLNDKEMIDDFDDVFNYEIWTH